MQPLPRINNVDLVVGVGRSLYDAMACGRAVISYDTRYADRNFEGDGYLDKTNIKESLQYNCCGGLNRRFFTRKDFILELKKYNHKDGASLRDVAVNELNISKSVEQYLAIYHKNINSYSKNKERIAYSGEINAAIDSLLREMEHLKSFNQPIIRKIVTRVKRLTSE